MRTKVFARIIIDIILALAVLQGWWFVAVPLCIIGCFAFPYYIEAIIAGVAYDSLFGMEQGMGWKGYIGTFVSIIILLIGYFGKKILKR